MIALAMRRSNWSKITAHAGISLDRNGTKLFIPDSFLFPWRRRTPQFPHSEGGAMKSILFVDDHEVLARLSCEILEMQGYRAVSACSGAEALKRFEQEEFDLLVTDFRMNGMNGLELARKLHEKSPNIPVIIVTGYDPIDGGKDIVDCLQKEDLFPALLEKIKTLLHEEELVTARTA